VTDALVATLRHLLARHGTRLLKDHRRLNAFLRDLHPDAPRSVAVAVEVVRSGLLRELRADDDAATRHGQVRRLRDGAGVAPRYGARALERWRAVLDLTSSPDLPVRRRASRISERPGSLDDVLSGALT